MPKTTVQMSKEEMRDMIEEVVERKLTEILGDPDEGVPLRKAVRDRLLRQKKAVAAEQHGRPFADVAKDLGL